MSADAEFARVAREYLDDRAERHPDIATGLGDHRFDARLADPSAQALDDERRALDGWAARLAAVNHGTLSAEHMALMTDRGFQEEGEAAGKWRRAQLTSAQLASYYVGYSEISDLATTCGRPSPA
jgi:alkylhydroperoxidase family enzyme